MVWRFFFPFVALVFFGCGGGGGKLPLPPEPIDDQSPLFAIQSSPPGAEIWLDGQRTPFHTTPIGGETISLPRPEKARHWVTVRLSGYHDWHQWVHWTGDASIIVRATLTPASEPHGTLVVTSEPVGAKIWLNGQEIGQMTPATLTLSPSRHALRLTLDGYFDALESVDVFPQKTTEVHIPLTPLDKGLITGVVYDRYGNGPMGATVQLLDEMGGVVAEAETTAFGAFRFDRVTPGTYTLTAEMTFEGVLEVGRADGVTVQAGRRTLAYLVLSPADLLGDVIGVVQTSDGRPISGAQVALLFYAIGLDFVLTSRRTVTDGQGRFRIEKVPAAPQVLVVRKEGFEPLRQQVIVSRGETTETTVTLYPLKARPPAPDPPRDIFAIAETFPLPSRGWGSDHDVYRRILRALLRRFAPDHPALKALSRPLKKPSRFFPRGFWAQVEVGWFPPSQPVLGYRVYRREPSASGWQFRFFVDEPEQTVVADGGVDFTPSRTYLYAVSSVGLDGRESEKSEGAETIVLSPIKLLVPEDGAQKAQSDLTFRWRPVTGMIPFYTVHLFESPEDVLMGGGTWWVITDKTEHRYDGKPLLLGKAYWWLVIGHDAPDWKEANAFSVSELRRVVVVGE